MICIIFNTRNINNQNIIIITFSVFEGSTDYDLTKYTITKRCTIWVDFYITTASVLSLPEEWVPKSKNSRFEFWWERLINISSSSNSSFRLYITNNFRICRKIQTKLPRMITKVIDVENTIYVIFILSFVHIKLLTSDLSK